MVEKLVYPPTTKSFNTAGPCLPGCHSRLPPLPRVPEAQALVVQHSDLVLHAPRHSTMTASPIAFAR